MWVVAVLRVSSPLKLKKTSYVHWLVEEIEELGKDDELEAIESRNRSAWKKNQLELKKNWEENKLWKKKNYLMQWFESLPSSDESNITLFFVLYEKEKPQISQTVQNSRASVGYVRQRWSRYMCLLVFCWELRGSLTVGNSGNSYRFRFRHIFFSLKPFILCLVVLDKRK